MKKLTYYFLTAFLSMTTVCCGNEETLPTDDNSGNNESNPQAATLELTRTGTQGILIKDLSSNHTQTLQVKYNTLQVPDKDIPFTLSAWTEAELEAYNQEKGNNYFLLPNDIYTIEGTSTIKQGQTTSDVSITIKTGELLDFLETEGGNKQYVLPLRLKSETVEVQQIRSEVIFTVSVYLPTLSFLSDDYGTVYLEEEDTPIQISTKLMIGNSNAQCSEPLHYTFKLPENATELIEKYNQTHGTGYELLPQAAYSVTAGVYNAGEGTSGTTVTIHKAQTGDGIYMLPLQLGDISGQKVLKDPATCFLTTGKHFYSNPIIRYSAPDPTVIRAQDGNFYLYGTEDTHNMPIYQSEDMVNWTYKNTAFTDATRPTWKGDHSLWAPEIRYINGKYVLYYSWAKWGDHWNSEVGVATADNPLGPFNDEGQVIDARKLNVENSIDQFEFEDGGKRYLFWGSFRGIYAVELNSDGLSVKCNEGGTPVFKQQVAGDAYEGTCIYKRGNWYYLFASIGSCCEGANSSYQTVVGRSDNLFGPYVNKNGGQMLNNQHEILISGDGNFVGTGHNSIIQHDDAGQTWMILHGYVKAEADNGRYVMLEQLLWDEEGWPYVKENGVLSAKSLAPVIK